MIKCPFCQFENEDGALFCEQCKSDLAMVEASAPTLPPPLPAADPYVAEPLQEAIPSAAPMVADVFPAAAEPFTEAPQPMAEPVGAEPVAMAAAVPAAEPVSLPTGTAPKLLVIRGVKMNVEYPIYEGENFLGRADEKPVDIDLEEQESPDRVWSSRQHACIIYSESQMTIEDLNSSNGTFVNRVRVYPGEKRPLNVNDVVQIGTVQMKVKL